MFDLMQYALIFYDFQLILAQMPCHPAPAGARAWGRPARPTLPAWRRPCQGVPEAPHARGGPALSGTARTGGWGRAAGAAGAAGGWRTR